MKKITNRILSLVLVCLLIVSIVPRVSAATVSSASMTSNTYGKNVMVFYVNAYNKNTTKVSYSCTSGAFVLKTGFTAGLRGYFEVLIYGRNNTGETWTYLSKTNIKNSSSTTLSMKGYTQYKVRVYAWNTATIGSYRGNNWNSANASWLSAPTCTFSAKSNVESLAK